MVCWRRGTSPRLVHEVMRRCSSAMVNDGNNTVEEAATLKIRFRSEVKHRYDGRVETACPVVSGGSVGSHGFAAGTSCA